MEAPTNTYPNEVVAPAPVTPPAPPTNKPSKKVIISIGLIIVVVLVLLTALLHPGIRSWIMSFTGVPLESRTVLLKGMNEEGAAMIYELKGGEVVPAEFPSGLVVASERAGIVAGISGTDVVIAKGSGNEVIFTDPEYKEGVAVSPAGDKIAFASMTPGATGVGVSRWYVKVVDLATREVNIVGQGYGPQFVLRDGKTYLLYTAENGIALADMSVGDSVVTPLTIEGSESYAVRVSDDGAYLAIRDALIGQYFLYKVDKIEEGVVRFSSLRQLPEGTVSAAFREGMIYGVSMGETGQELLVYPSIEASEPEMRIALPSSSGAYELLP